MYGHRASLRVEALGPMQVRRGPVLVDLGPAKQRAVFALLALRAGNSVSMSAFLDAIWGSGCPPSARHLVHTYIARLRQLLEPEMPRRGRVHVIGSAPTGYRLLVETEQIDVTRFQELFAQAQRRLGAGDSSRAFELLGEGLRLWRDPTLSDLCRLLPGSDEVEVLQRAWVEAALEYVTVGLDLGEAATVLPLAQRLAAAEPMHEEIQARYLAALEQTGRRAAAIEHFSDVRARLSLELGVDPGPSLAGAYQRVLLAPENEASSRVHLVNISIASRPPWRGTGPGLGQLIERERELAALTRILSEQRLLTLAGPPGCGKSALALQTAARLRDTSLGGVAVSECSSLRSYEQLNTHLLTLLGSPSDGPDVAKVLGDQQVILVLDNVEHLVDECAAMVDDIVRVCRHVTVIVTSREPLSLPYETVWRVSALAVPDPDDLEWPGDCSSVQLFVQRATQVCPDFKLEPDNARTVATICRMLDGLPLALELAASCLATDALDGLLRRLENPLRELQPPRRGLPAHHRGLWAALWRSVECLTERERWCFVSLGALGGRFDLAEAQKVWESSPWSTVDVCVVLTRLVDKSLLYVSHGPAGPSYRILSLMHQLAIELAAEITHRAGER